MHRRACSAALAVLLLSAGCDDPNAPNPRYTGALRVVLTPRDPAKKAPRDTNENTSFAFKTTDGLAELTFGACKATFERPKAKSDRFKWPVKSGGACPTAVGAAKIERGDFVTYPGGGLMITLAGSTDDGAFGVEWSTVIGPPK